MPQHNGFRFPGSAIKSTEAPQGSVMASKGNPFGGTFQKFWAVEDPLVVTDALPRDIQTNSTKQGLNTTVPPTAAKLNMFGSKDLAAQYAQSLNRPLVILEVTCIARVVPQLPSVEEMTEQPKT